MCQPLCLCERAREKKKRRGSSEAPQRGWTVDWEGGSAGEHWVSKANFQSHSRALISHCEVASVASGLHVVMDTKAWDPRDGEPGTNGCPVYRIPVSSCLIDGIDGSFVIL